MLRDNKIVTNCISVVLRQKNLPTFGDILAEHLTDPLLSQGEGVVVCSYGAVTSGKSQILDQSVRRHLPGKGRLKKNALTEARCLKVDFGPHYQPDWPPSYEALTKSYLDVFFKSEPLDVPPKLHVFEHPPVPRLLTADFLLLTSYPVMHGHTCKYFNKFMQGLETCAKVLPLTKAEISKIDQALLFMNEVLTDDQCVREYPTDRVVRIGLMSERSRIAKVFTAAEKTIEESSTYAYYGSPLRRVIKPLNRVPFVL